MSTVFFFNDTATTEIYPLSLHDALPFYFFVEFREWIHKRDTGHAPENDYLIAYDKKLFRTYGGLDIYEVPEFEAVGAGEDFAKAALHLGHTPREAVEVACKLSIYCSEPISEIVVEL